MPYEKSGQTVDDSSFEVIYTGFRSNYNANVGKLASGVQVLSTAKTGSVVLSRKIVGADANRIVWLFNTSASSNSATGDLYKRGTVAGTYDELPGVTTMSFYHADGETKIGEVTHSADEGWDRVGGGTSQQGYISSPPAVVQFTISASHDMSGYIKSVTNGIGDFGDKTKIPII